MIFPNPKLAVVDVSKLRDYCLDPHHPRGRHKARVFARALGMKQEHAAILRELILEAVPGAKCAPSLVDEYGTRFSAELRISFRNHSVIIHTAWLIAESDDFPKLTTCYIK